MSVLDRLTEGVVNRNLQKEGAALLNKWEKTGLLEGMGDENAKSGMARLLENQAKELLREASSMAAGDVQGFAAVAFPIVRRVFGSLIANDLVSVQPMSLPSGLIFFLDFTFANRKLDQGLNTSLYGGGRVASQITGGVVLTDQNAERSFYALNQGYSSPTGAGRQDMVLIASGVVGSNFRDDAPISASGPVTAASYGGGNIATNLSKLCQYDPDLEGKSVVVYTMPSNLTAVGSDGDGQSATFAQFNRNDMITIDFNDGGNPWCTADGQNTGEGVVCRHVRRLTDLVGASAADAGLALNALPINSAASNLVLVFESTSSVGSEIITADMTQSINRGGARSGPHRRTNFATCSFAITDQFNNVGAGAIGAVVGANAWGLEEPKPSTGLSGSGDAKNVIPEIDIKVDSVAVTAITKKLKAKWSPELGQDLQAYHNLDAEVELTSILSEQIALEIDREILEDLIKGATAETYYWSRRPGLFVNRNTGADTSNGANPPDFTGTVSEWYETLLETVNDVSAQIHRKTLRGGANFLVCSPEVANLLEFTTGFRASVTADTPKGTAGAIKVGQISKKWDIYVDPYFVRNVILVGRKGGSFLESGYVYSPYVPLQVTPTIFGTEDFVPRKGVMTRYAKKMVRPDMYGLVIIQNLLG